MLMFCILAQLRVVMQAHGVFLESTKQCSLVTDKCNLMIFHHHGDRVPVAFAGPRLNNNFYSFFKVSCTRHQQLGSRLWQTVEVYVREIIY